jgi:hypothetical protein
VNIFKGVHCFFSFQERARGKRQRDKGTALIPLPLSPLPSV